MIVVVNDTLAAFSTIYLILTLSLAVGALAARQLALSSLWVTITDPCQVYIATNALRKSLIFAGGFTGLKRSHS